MLEDFGDDEGAVLITPEKQVSMRKVGRYIAQRRTDLGMTQQELADKTGYTDSYITQLERGVKAGTPEAFKKLAKALNIPSGVLQNKYADEPDEVIDSEIASDLVRRLMKLSPAARIHVENQIGLLLQIPSAPITHPTEEQLDAWEAEVKANSPKRKAGKEAK